jgi:hypothetical protein
LAAASSTDGVFAAAVAPSTLSLFGGEDPVVGGGALVGREGVDNVWRGFMSEDEEDEVAGEDEEARTSD